MISKKQTGDFTFSEHPSWFGHIFKLTPIIKDGEKNSYRAIFRLAACSNCYLISFPCSRKVKNGSTTNDLKACYIFLHHICSPLRLPYVFCRNGAHFIPAQHQINVIPLDMHFYRLRWKIRKMINEKVQCLFSKTEHIWLICIFYFYVTWNKLQAYFAVIPKVYISLSHFGWGMLAQAYFEKAIKKVNLEQVVFPGRSLLKSTCLKRTIFYLLIKHIRC